MNDHARRGPVVRRRDFLIGLGGAALTVVAVPRVLRAAGAPIKVGAVLHLSGPLAAYGQEQRTGLDLYAKRVNAKGGILGRPVELLVEDDGSRPQVSVEKARKLVALDRIDVLTGSMLTGSLVAIVQYVKEVNVPYLSIGGTTNTAVTPPNCDRYHFHFSSIPATVGSATLTIAPRFGDNAKWFFVGTDIEFGHQGVDTIRAYAARVAKIKDVGQAFPPLGTKDFTPVASVVAAARPDVVAISLSGFDHGQLIKQLRLFGITAHIHSLHLSTIDAASAGDAALGMTGGTFFLHENPKVPRVAEYTEEFHRASGRWPAGFCATATTAMEMYQAAVEKVGGTDKAKVADTIGGLVLDKSLLGVARVRRCDGQLVSTTYPAEIVRHPKYGTTYKALGEISDVDAEKNLTPCDQTGCEPAMKRS